VLVASRGQRSTLPEAMRLGFAASLTKPLRRDAMGPALAALTQRGERPVTQAPARAPSAGLRTKYQAVSIEEAKAAGTLILVAEDNPTNQIVMRNLMTRLGYTIEIAGNGIEALDMLHRRSYGLLITDCHMPEMDGYELTTRLRSEEAGSGRHLPVIALTGDALAGAAQYCLDVGMDDYLTKPVSIQLLDGAIKRWLPAAAELRRETVEGDAGQAAAEPSPAPFVPNVLKDIFGELSDDAFDLFDRFVDGAHDSLRNLRDALGRADYAAAREVAHRAGSGAKSVGAAEFAQICTTMESLLVGQRVAEAQGLLDKLSPALARAAQTVATVRSSGIQPG
jgi:CheY-like chemotaxis protein